MQQQTNVEHNIIIVDEDTVADTIVDVIRLSYGTQYILRKAASVTEALYWLDTLHSYEIHALFLGLEEARNRELICYMEGVNIRDEYNIVLLVDVLQPYEHQPPLRVEGYASKLPFRSEQFLQQIDRFAGRSLQLV